MTVLTRFAPSPTGQLHVGNIRAALHNRLWGGKSRPGRFICCGSTTLDAERSSEERYVEAIRADLAWLGLSPDGEERQSARFALYEARFAALREAGHVYPAYETAQELDLKRKIAAGRGLPPVYDRAALALSDAERAAFEAEGWQPHWRLRARPRSADRMGRSDPRASAVRPGDDERPGDSPRRRISLYMLPSAIDDAEMGVSHVVRGEDHVSNTALQLQMFAALGSAPPAFAHEALLVGSEGKLSKRFRICRGRFVSRGGNRARGGAGVARANRDEPAGRTARSDTAELVTTFDFGKFGRAPARFDEAELAALNARIVHQLAYDTIAARLPAGMGRAEWEVVRPNLTSVAEAADWWRVIEGPIEADIDSADRDFLAEAAALAATIDWSADPWACADRRDSRPVRSAPARHCSCRCAVR